jgi:hypothetical protein
VTLKARVVVFSKDSTRNYAVRYERRAINRNGSVSETVALGAAADSSFHAGTEAVWKETLTLPAGDSVVSHERAYKVRLSPAPGAFAGNTLSGLNVAIAFHNLSYGRFTFGFRPEAPVADGKWISTGAVEATLSYRQGATISFGGQAVAGGMEGTVVTSTGAALPVFFDRNGNATRRP